MGNDLVFLSYSRQDEAAATRLFDELRAAGVNVWLDKERILPGQHWRDQISSAIRSSRFFIALLSTKSVSRRGYVNEELTDALSILNEFPRDQIFLIPARLDECVPTHTRLRDLHWVDLFPDWHNGVKRIFDALGVREEPSGSAGIGVGFKILKPKGGDRVTHVVPMHGTIYNHSPEQELWAVTIPRAGSFHPNRGPAIINGTSWRATAYVGNRSIGADSGEEFKIQMILTSHELGRRFHDYLDQAHVTGAWIGLESLGDSRIMAEVLVIRDDAVGNVD